MAYEFKNLNEVPAQEKPTENTTVMAFEDGSPRQIPAGEFGGKGLVVDLRGYTLSTNGSSSNIISDISYDPIYEAIMVGRNVVFQLQIEGLDVFVEPGYSAVIPGEGLMVMLIIFNDVELYFTNGSYHTTA